MSIIQRNVFGNDIIYNVSQNHSRQLTSKLQQKIIETLKELKVLAVVIRFEHNSKTALLAHTIAKFLEEDGFRINNIVPVTMSEIQNNEFSIRKHPSVSTCAIIKLGLII